MRRRPMLALVLLCSLGGVLPGLECPAVADEIGARQLRIGDIRRNEVLLVDGDGKVVSAVFGVPAPLPGDLTGPAAQYRRVEKLLAEIAAKHQSAPVQRKAQGLLVELTVERTLGTLRELQPSGCAGLEALRRPTTGVTRTMPTTGGKATEAQREQRARELLKQAQAAYQAKRFLECLDCCELLSGSYGDLAAGIEGMQLANKINDDPGKLQSACHCLSSELSKTYMTLVEVYLHRNDPARALVYLERVIASDMRHGSRMER